MPAQLATRLSASIREGKVALANALGANNHSGRCTHDGAATGQHQKRPPTLAGKLGRLFASCVLIGITYAALYLSIGKPFYYGGPAWSTMLIWAAAQGAGWVFGMVKLPSLLGQLLIGLVLRNAAPSSVSGLPASWSAVLRTSALGIIFLRSGLELDLRVFRRVGGAAVRLLLIPGLTEAFTTGSLAVPLLGLPLMWGYSLGFILKAVGPAVIITTMYEVQKQKLGIAKGIPSIIIAAASFDDMVAITGYSLFSNFAFAKGSGNLGWQIAHGPVEIVLGFVAGVICGLFCSITIMWRSRYQRTVVALMTSMTMIFLFNHYHMKSAGPLACLITGMVMRVLSDRGLPRLLSLGPNPDFTHQVEVDLGRLWRWAAQPLLFGIIGTMVNLRTLSNPGILPRSLALIVLGLIVRTPMSFLAVAGAGLTLQERIFVAIAWTPKATVQAALGPLPLDTIRAQANPDPDDLIYAETILTTSVLAILVCAFVGVIGVHLSAPRLLARGNEPSHGTHARKEWKQRMLQEAAQGRMEDGTAGGPPGAGGAPGTVLLGGQAVVSADGVISSGAVDTYGGSTHRRSSMHADRLGGMHVGGGAGTLGHTLMTDSDEEDEEDGPPIHGGRGNANLESFSSWRAAVSGALTTASSHLHQLWHPGAHRPSETNSVIEPSGMTSAPSAPALMQSVPNLNAYLAMRNHNNQRSRMGTIHAGVPGPSGFAETDEEPCTPHLCGEVDLAKKQAALAPSSPDETDSEPPSCRSSNSPRESPLTPTSVTNPLAPTADAVNQQQHNAHSGSSAHITWADQQRQSAQQQQHLRVAGGAQRLLSGEGPLNYDYSQSLPLPPRTNTARRVQAAVVSAFTASSGSQGPASSSAASSPTAAKAEGRSPRGPSSPSPFQNPEYQQQQQQQQDRPSTTAGGAARPHKQ